MMWSSLDANLRRARLLLRARMVLPVTKPPIEDGAVLLRGSRIVEVGTWSGLKRSNCDARLDLGEVVLLPGLVNAHCHLDYTHMAGQLPPPKLFTDWLKLIVATKAGWSVADYMDSWQAGAQMLLHTGTTTVADIEAVPELLPHAWEATPLRVFSFFEMIGITGKRLPSQILQETCDRITALERWAGRAGLSPHAPYSTVPELLQLSAEAARRHRWRVVTHVGESATEYEMFKSGRGEMYRWIQKSGRSMTDCGLGLSPVQHLERSGLLGRNLLAVHANYLHREDPGLLARHNVTVVHCPRSHAYFGHRAFPLRSLLRAGVNLALGTDSLATVYKRRRESVRLDMFEEMRTLCREHRASPALALQFATVNGARGLGLEGKLGEISSGAAADLIAVPFKGPRRSAFRGVVEHRGNVAASMINGRWVVAPGSSN